MIRNFLKVTVRNFDQNRFFSFVNIGGLAVGMSVALLIGLWIKDELQFDDYHARHDKIVRVMEHYTFNDTRDTGPAISFPVVTALRTNYPNDFQYVVMSSWPDEHILSSGKDVLSKRGYFMDPEAPRLFSLRITNGSVDALKEPSSVMLSRSVATAFFGDNDPVNQIMKIDNLIEVKVAAVYEDLPKNTTYYDAGFIAPFELYERRFPGITASRDQWQNNSYSVIALLSDNADLEKVNNRIRNIKYDNVDQSGKASKPEIFLNPMNDWHLRSEFKNGLKDGGLIRYVWMFGITGAFVLLLAVINFMTLSISRSAERAREVGIRKSLGAGRRQLVWQFLGESLVFSLLAFFLAITIVHTSIPFFNQLTGKEIGLPFDQFSFWGACLVFTSITGFFAGVYPAFYISSFQPVNALKKIFSQHYTTLLPQKSLIVIQFIVSVSLIIGTLVVYRQINYAKDRPLGYDRNNVITLQIKSDDVKVKYNSLRDELKRKHAVEEMAGSSSPLTAVWSYNGSFSWEGKDPGLQANFGVVWVTHDFGKTAGWQITEGRDFSREHPGDSSGMILNETAAKLINLKDPVGKTIHWGDPVNGKDFKIVGIVKDLMMNSPFRRATQTIFVNGYDNVNCIEMKLKNGVDKRLSVAAAGNVFKQMFPSLPFDYQFADDAYSAKFKAEERIGKLSGIFGGLAVFISCLGLTGLAMFVARQRTKEIGVRKVLGASIISLWKMLVYDFALLVMVSWIIAVPMVYYLATQWLAGYEYRSPLSWSIFAEACAGVLTITVITVSFQALKAAGADPVTSLRSE